MNVAHIAFCSIMLSCDMWSVLYIYEWQKASYVCGNWHGQWTIIECCGIIKIPPPKKNNNTNNTHTQKRRRLVRYFLFRTDLPYLCRILDDWSYSATALFSRTTRQAKWTSSRARSWTSVSGWNAPGDTAWNWCSRVATFTDTMDSKKR